VYVVTRKAKTAIIARGYVQFKTFGASCWNCADMSVYIPEYNVYKQSLVRIRKWTWTELWCKTVYFITTEQKHNFC